MTPDPSTSPPSNLPSSEESGSLSGYLPGEQEPANSLIAARARAHWQKWRPNELAQLADPQAFFEELSREAQRQIEDLGAHLAGQGPPGEPYLEQVGRLRMARFDATALVMRDLVLLPPEPGHPDEETEQPDPMGSADLDDGWLPVVLTPGHPRYHDLDDDPGLSKP